MEIEIKRAMLRATGGELRVCAMGIKKRLKFNMPKFFYADVIIKNIEERKPKSTTGGPDFMKRIEKEKP